MLQSTNVEPWPAQDQRPYLSLSQAPVSMHTGHTLFYQALPASGQGRPRLCHGLMVSLGWPTMLSVNASRRPPLCHLDAPRGPILVKATGQHGLEHTGSWATRHSRTCGLEPPAWTHPKGPGRPDLDSKKMHTRSLQSSKVYTGIVLNPGQVGALWTLLGKAWAAGHTSVDTFISLSTRSASPLQEQSTMDANPLALPLAPPCDASSLM